MRALWCIGRYNAPRRATATPPRTPADFASADAELADVLDSLGANAPNYTDWIADLCRPYLGRRVLEVGAGHGDLTTRFAGAGAEVLATDISKRCLDVLDARFADDERVTVAHLDLFDHTDPGGYDSAVLVNVLEHLPDDRAALEELRRLVRPGGHVLLYVPAFERLYSPFDRAVGHYRRYDRPTLAGAVRAAGLQVVEARYVNQLGALAWWLLATKLKQVPTEPGKVRLYDRAVVPRLRKVEERYRTEFGQSLFLAAGVP
jgi:SAM-dependent methyltransferase